MTGGTDMLTKMRLAQRTAATLRWICLGWVPLAGAACGDSPVAPTDYGPVPEAAYLIGSSPLITLDASGQGAGLDVRVEVTRGMARTGAEDRFEFRVLARFAKGGATVSEISGCIDIPSPAKDTEIRKGGLVPVGLRLPIPDPDWALIRGASTGPGDPVDVRLTVELMLIDGAGKEHVLDRVDGAGAIDPWAQS